MFDLLYLSDSQLQLEYQLITCEQIVAYYIQSAYQSSLINLNIISISFFLAVFIF